MVPAIIPYIIDNCFLRPRSWKAHLSSLCSTIRKRRSRSPHLLCDMNLPWYQYFTHLEDHDPLIYETSEKALAIAPKAFPPVLSNPSQSAGTKLSDMGQQWKQILPVQLSQEVVKLECKSVTGAKALFVILTDDKALTLALWDFESQDVAHYQFGKNSVYVDCNEEVPLCLLLTGDFLCVIVLVSSSKRSIVLSVAFSFPAGWLCVLAELWSKCRLYSFMLLFWKTGSRYKSCYVATRLYVFNYDLILLFRVWPLLNSVRFNSRGVFE